MFKTLKSVVLGRLIIPLDSVADSVGCSIMVENPIANVLISWVFVVFHWVFYSVLLGKAGVAFPPLMA